MADVNALAVLAPRFDPATFSALGRQDALDAANAAAGQLAAGGDLAGAQNYLLAHGFTDAAKGYTDRIDAANKVASSGRIADAFAKGDWNSGMAESIRAGQPQTANYLANLRTSNTDYANSAEDRQRATALDVHTKLARALHLAGNDDAMIGQILDHAKSHGITDADEYRSPAGRAILYGRAGIEPAPAKKDLMAVAPGSTVWDPATGKALYSAPPKTPGGLSLPAGVDVKMAEKAVDAVDAADSLLDGIRVLRDVSGIQQGDGSYKLRPDMAAAVGPEPEFGGAYKWAKSQIGITGAAGAAQRLDQAKRGVIAKVTAAENKGQGVISDTERKMYEQFLGDLAKAPDERTFFDLINQLERFTAASRDRHAARRPIGLADVAASQRQDLAVPLDGAPAAPAGAPMQAPGAPQGGAGKAAPAQGPRQAPDGHWYVEDPARPGKYLRIDQ
jgi:hypothetical protein